MIGGSQIANGKSIMWLELTGSLLRKSQVCDGRRRPRERWCKHATFFH